MIEKLSATAPDPALCNSILPRACRTDPCGVHASGCQQFGDLVTKLAVTIKNRIAVRTRFRKCLSHLLHYPGAVGCSVTLKWRIRRRPCSMMKKQYKTWNVRVDTVKKSMAAMASR